MTAIRFRDGRAADTRALAQISIDATHGIVGVKYRRQARERPLSGVVAERRILRQESPSHYADWRVAADGSGAVMGGLNAFPMTRFATVRPDPEASGEGLALLSRLNALEEQAGGDFYVNLVGVLEAHRRAGVGRALMAEADRLARAAGCRRLVLGTFAGDAAAMTFYPRAGYRLFGTCPIGGDPADGLDGLFAVFVRDL